MEGNVCMTNKWELRSIILLSVNDFTCHDMVNSMVYNITQTRMHKDKSQKSNTAWLSAKVLDNSIKTYVYIHVSA